MRPSVLALLLSVAVATSCFVNTRSDQLACKVTTDCTAPRQCVSGECVVDTSCPSVCNGGCAAGNCSINGNGGADVTCPDGMTCSITCLGDQCGSISCTNAASCTINCVGASACNNITCGAADCMITCNGASACNDVTCGVQQGGSKQGRCRVGCTGASACGNVTCSNSCDCVVDGCANGDCGTLTCPRVGGTFCTGTGNNGDPCTDTNSGCSC